jgi:ABC-2 type transport system permease protein
VTRLLHSEVLKITTTRGVWGFVLAVGAIAGVSAAGQIGTTPRDVLSTDESLDDLLAAAGSSSLFALLAGIVGFTSEFRHGTATQTFLVAPARERVLAAKLLAHALLGAALGLLAIAVTLAIALPWLGAKGIELPLGDREHLLILGGALGSAVLWGALGAALGASVRNQVFGVVAALVWILIVEHLVGALRDEVAPYLPGRASGAMIGNDFLDDDLSRVGGTLVTLGYVAVAFVLGVATLRARDVS